jgi:hypothetical protein
MYRVIYAAFTNRAITNLSHAQATDDAGQINATFFAIFQSSALSLVELLPSAYRVDKPITCFGQVPISNFYEHLTARAQQFQQRGQKVDS